MVFVTTPAAQVAVLYGCVCMSTRPVPRGSVSVEIRATRNVIFPGSVGLAQAHPLTKPLAMGDGLPPDLVQLRSTLPIRALVLVVVVVVVAVAVVVVVVVVIVVVVVVVVVIVVVVVCRCRCCCCC